MHHSDKLNRQTAAVTCYLDESATDGSTPIAVVGGLALNRSYFNRLNTRWNRLINNYNLHPALHMKDFGRHGRFSDMPEDRRHRIFGVAVDIIEECSIYTLATTVDHAQYKTIFPRGFNEQLSQYALCFLACVLGNHLIAESNNYHETTAFVIDEGNVYASQVFEAHKSISEIQKAGKENYALGSLTFESDHRVTALQAADMVCWAAGRRAAKKPFGNGFEPLEEILKREGHNESPVPEDSMRDLLHTLRTKFPEMNLLRNGD